jgi:hypothetical protein
MGGHVQRSNRKIDELMNLHEKPTTQADINSLIENIREEDRREIISKTGSEDIKKTLVNGWLISDYCNSFFKDDVLIGIYGVVAAEKKEIGSPFMLLTKEIKSTPIGFLKHCREKVSDMEKRYSILFNYIDSRNDLHLRWLKWLGFEIINEKIFNKVPFYGFFKGEK